MQPVRMLFAILEDKFSSFSMQQCWVNQTDGQFTVLIGARRFTAYKNNLRIEACVLT